MLAILMTLRMFNRSLLHLPIRIGMPSAREQQWEPLWEGPQLNRDWALLWNPTPRLVSKASQNQIKEFKLPLSQLRPKKKRVKRKTSKNLKKRSTVSLRTVPDSRLRKSSPKHWLRLKKLLPRRRRSDNLEKMPNLSIRSTSISLSTCSITWPTCTTQTDATKSPWTVIPSSSRTSSTHRQVVLE